MKMTSAILVLMFATGAAHAQSLTLDTAIREAKAANPDVQRLQARAQRLSWAKLDAASIYVPHLSAAYEHEFDAKYMRETVIFGGAPVSFPAAYPQDSINLEAEWTLFDGFGGVQRFRAASLEAEAAELELHHANTALEKSVRNAFYQALAAEKLRAVAEQNVKTLEDHVSRARLVEKAGYGTGFDVLRIQATLEEARAEAESAINNVAIVRSKLSELLGLDHVDERSLTGDLPVLSAELLPKDLGVSAEKREDVQAQLKRETASEKRASAAQSTWYPSLSVFATEQFYKFGDFDPAIASNSSFQQAWGVGLRLKWNLFDGGHSYAQQREAGAAAAEAQAESRKVLNKLPQEVDTWKRKFQYSLALYKARQRSVTQFQESVRLAGIGVRAGTRTNTEMLDAELDLFRARGGVVRAQAEAAEALGQLELATGRELFK